MIMMDIYYFVALFFFFFISKIRDGWRFLFFFFFFFSFILLHYSISYLFIVLSIRFLSSYRSYTVCETRWDWDMKRDEK